MRSRSRWLRLGWLAGLFACSGTTGGGALLPDGGLAPSSERAPTLTAIASSPSVVDLSWTEGAQLWTVSGYRVLREGSQRAEVAASSRSFRDTGLSAATTYRYQVRAMGPQGAEGPASAEISVTTPPSTVASTIGAPTVCAAPVALADISAPKAVVGDGTPQSCTAAALQAAVAGGGTVVFDCGLAPMTLTLTAPIVVTQATVIDGGGRVTLSGGGKTRILVLDSGYDKTGPGLTVQRLTFRDGYGPAGVSGGPGGGGAIYRDGGSLTVIDSVFLDNRGPTSGQDDAGGAIYAFGGGETVIVGSVFQGNASSNGGAIGSLNGDLTLVNSALLENSATGTGGNPGDGGAGGALYQDGGDEKSLLCGVMIRGNRANAIGGGVFRVSNDGKGSFSMDRSTVDQNVIPNQAKSTAGGLYLQGLALTITNSTVSRNEASFNGGIWISGGTVQLTNSTFAHNVALSSHGGGFWLANDPTGTVLNCTLANNEAAGSNGGMGAVFGPGLTFKNTLFAGNRAASSWGPYGCDKVHGEGGGNLEWPDDPRGPDCTPSLTVANPLLGALDDNGGPTATLLPGAGSAARAKGAGCPPADQRGNPRSEPCTSGAVEVP